MLLARCLGKRDQGPEAFVNYTQALLNAEVRESEQLHAQPPENCNPVLTDGRRVVWRVRKAMLVSEHLRDASKNICLAN